MKKLKPLSLVLALLITGVLSVRNSYGQAIQSTVQSTVASTRVGPTITSPQQPVTISPWVWPVWGISQPQIQPQLQPQRGPYRTYWTNPDPTRIFPRLTQSVIIGQMPSTR